VCRRDDPKVLFAALDAFSFDLLAPADLDFAAGSTHADGPRASTQDMY
jgi:hypothetical protein